jgi:hypothetical protein
VHRVEVVHRVLAANRGERYLEIGVSRGLTFHRIECRTKVAVDPHFRFRVPVSAHLRRRRNPSVAGARYFEIPSDEFFAEHAAALGPFDAVLVDGLHTADQAFRDVVHAAAHLSPAGVIVMHDCNPRSAPAAAPTLDEATAMAGYTGEWNGDVFKAVVRTRVTEPTLDAFVLDCDQGLGIVRRRAEPGVTSPAPAIDPAAIDALTYEDLDRDRRGLLDLRPPEAIDAVLEAVAEQARAGRTP